MRYDVRNTWQMINEFQFPYPYPPHFRGNLFTHLASCLEGRMRLGLEYSSGAHLERMWGTYLSKSGISLSLSQILDYNGKTEKSFELSSTSENACNVHIWDKPISRHDQDFSLTQPRTLKTAMILILRYEVEWSRLYISAFYTWL